MTRLVFIVPVILLLGTAALFWFGLNAGPPETLPSPLIGQPAPDFVLPPPDGQARGLSRADLVGHPSVVNFWASWCAPCRLEHPMLRALASAHRFALYGIVYKDRPDAARAFLNELGDPFARLGADASGRTAIDWGVTGVPETFVIDAKGIVRAHYSGPLTPDVVQSVILPALNPPQP